MQPITASPIFFILHRISSALLIRNRLVYLCLLCLAVLEELLGYRREQCIGEYILILLLPLCTFLLKFRQFRLN